jgi:hypothetical protein
MGKMLCTTLPTLADNATFKGRGKLTDDVSQIMSY